MPIAAVPRYLGSNFGDASPGLRFGLYLAIWTTRADQEAEIQGRAGRRSREGEALAELLRQSGMDGAIERLCQARQNPLARLWEKNTAAETEAWRNTTRLGRSDKERVAALCRRQEAMRTCVPLPALLCVEASSIAPFTTGLGNEHPLENGFSFLNPYGLPYFPGSGVKGVLRQAARELASGDWGKSGGWSTEEKYAIPRETQDDEKEPPVLLDMIGVLFGRETPEGDTNHFRGALTFWDVIPEIKGDSLMVEVMTPHQSHYYQPNQQKDSAGSASPHESGQPNPICFLTVPPGSKFVFHVICDTAMLERVAPDLVEQWKGLLEKAFEHAFQWLGFGAKTAVGYGAMKRLGQQAPAPASAPGAQAAEKPVPVQQGVVWENAMLTWDPGQRAVIAHHAGKKTVPLQEKNLDAFLAQLGEEKTDVLKKRRELTNVSVRVEEQGNRLTLLGLAEG